MVARVLLIAALLIRSYACQSSYVPANTIPFCESPHGLRCHHVSDLPGSYREWLAGRSTADNTTASQEILQLSNGPMRLDVSTGTGRLLALTSRAGLLSAELNSEVHLHHCAS